MNNLYKKNEIIEMFDFFYKSTSVKTVLLYKYESVEIRQNLLDFKMKT